MPKTAVPVVHAKVSLDNPSNLEEAILEALPESFGPRVVTVSLRNCILRGFGMDS